MILSEIIILWIKEERDYLASVVLWGYINAHDMGNLDNCKDTSDTEQYIEILEQHRLPILFLS